MMNKETLIFICGGDEIASSIAIKLFKSKLTPVVYIAPNEIFLRHNLSLGDAVYQNQKIVNDVTATLIPEDLIKSGDENTHLEKIGEAIHHLIKDRKIPILYQISFADAFGIVNPGIIINTLREESQSFTPVDPLITIGCYPHHFPGKDCRLAVETRLNYGLGQIYYPETQIFSENRTEAHFFKNPFATCPTPIEGVWVALKEIGEKIRYNEPLGKIDEIEIKSPYDGQIWGIVHSGKYYQAKTAIAKIYMGLPSENYRYFSFRENAIAGGVLEAVLQMMNG